MSRRDLQKAVNLRHQSWAVMHLGDGDDTIILEGPATLVSDTAEVDAVDRAWSARYVDPGTGTRDTVRVPDVDVWRVDPAHVMTWAHGNVTTPYRLAPNRALSVTGSVPAHTDRCAVAVSARPRPAATMSA